MSSEHDQDALMIGSLMREGRISAQVPDQLWILDQNATPEQAQAAHDDHEARIGKLVEQGMLAWKVGNPQPGRPKVIYTVEPRNPQTNRLVSAYLWMTPLAVMTYGKDMYSAYTKAVADKQAKYPQVDGPVSLDEFTSTLLVDTVPAAPAFASGIPADILAATVPKKKTAPKAGGKTATGDVAVLGARNSEEIIFTRDRGQAFLSKLDQWKVGPSTKLIYSKEETAPGGDGYIERAAISASGVAGIDWLVNKGFTAHQGWYGYALTMSGPDSILLLDKIKQLGLDPKATSEGPMEGTLWHLLPKSQWTEDKVQWIKQQGVDWAQPDRAGNLPLSDLLWQINTSLNTRGFFQMGLGGGMSMENMMSMFIPGLAQEIEQEKKEEGQLMQALIDLAVEMVQSGVDPFQKALDGSFPWQGIHPEQMHTQQLLASRLPQGTQDIEGEVMRQMFFGDRDALQRDREAFCPEMIAFIERIEDAYGAPLLDPPPSSPNPKRLGR